MLKLIPMALFLILVTVLVGWLYIRKTVGDPHVISKEKLEELMRPPR